MLLGHIVEAIVVALPVAVGLPAIVFARRSRSVKHRVVDICLRSDLVRLLEESTPGNPRDREIWAVLKRYGLWHFLDQVLLQAGIFCQTSKENPEAEMRRPQIDEATRSAVIAIAGCLVESAVNFAGIRAGHLQAFLAADQFRSLCVDVEDTMLRQQGR